MKKHPQISHSKRKGFTLIELLVVLAIILTLASITIPAIDATLRGSELTQASAEMAGFLKQARQYAITTNHRVEVCFYQCANTDAGESVENPSTWKYRAFQAFIIDDKTGAFTPLTQVQRLPFAVVMNSTVTLSPLLNPGDTNLTSASKATAPHLLNSNYVGFHFQRDGRTDLPLVSNYYLTLHTLAANPEATNPPKNFATISIDAANGAVSVYRP